MPTVNLDQKKVVLAKEYAKQIVDQVQGFVDQHSTLSIERSVLRLIGVDGVQPDGTPLVNVIVDQIKNLGLIENGVFDPFVKAMLELKLDVQETAEEIANNKVSWDQISLKDFSNQKIEKKLVKKALDVLDRTKKVKNDKLNQLKKPRFPWKYIIVATGNIYEDRIQAQAAVHSGADVVAIIRTTAQSLLDYVPFGPTTTGFGGTYATQENFRIMREALDEFGEKEGRYIRLVNYSSGLCMSEIAVCAAFEDLDMLLNDSMYGILFRDINMKRTFIDQYFSRLICAKAGIYINTGEDNYLTTADAIENAYTVTASQLINHAMALKAKLSEEYLGLGHAFEINPEVENAFLYELAHAQLTRELFPQSPIKYMPPTKYKKTDIFYSHAMDTLFNFSSILTNQGIHLTGLLTEAIHTPFMQDRFKSLSSVNYVFHLARDLSQELEFKSEGFVVQRAHLVLDEAIEFLKEILNKGLMESISEGRFADVRRSIDGGKGLSGVFKKGLNYNNPILEALK